MGSGKFSFTAWAYKKPSWRVRYRAATQPPSTKNRRRSISRWRVLAERDIAFLPFCKSIRSQAAS